METLREGIGHSRRAREARGEAASRPLRPRSVMWRTNPRGCVESSDPGSRCSLDSSIAGDASAVCLGFDGYRTELGERKRILAEVGCRDECGQQLSAQRQSERRIHDSRKALDCVWVDAVPSRSLGLARPASSSLLSTSARAQRGSFEVDAYRSRWSDGTAAISSPPESSTL